MSFFRKQPQAPAEPPAPTAAEGGFVPEPTPPSQPKDRLFDGPTVDVSAVYQSARLSADELDRVTRAEGLLHLLPPKSAHTREIVDATLVAFGVDRARIIEAAGKQLDALERFVRYSQEQTQGVLDVTARRVAELEAEIEHCRQTAALATREGEERARTVNNEMVKVQRVLEFFDGESDGDGTDAQLDETTGLNKPSTQSGTLPPRP